MLRSTSMVVLWTAALAMLPPASPAHASTGGTLDPGFGAAGVTTATFTGVTHAAALAIQPDGRIVLAGYAGTGSASSFALARLDANGALDPSFGTGGTTTTHVSIDLGSAVLVQPDGASVVAGTSYTSTTGGVGRVMLARYDASGALDATFGVAGIVITPPLTDAEANAVVRQPDGRLVVAGRDAGELAVWRYESDGTLDATFGSGGMVTTPVGPTRAVARAVVLEPDGRIVVAGSAASTGGDDDVALARYHDDGTLDVTFGSGGIVTTPLGSLNDAATALLRDPDGRVVVAGHTQVSTSGVDVRFALLRYDAAGQLDPGFGTGGVLIDSSAAALAQGIARQADGKLVAAGTAAVDFGGIVQSLARVARYDDAGNPDPSFGSGGGVTSPWDDYSAGAAVALQADGRILVAGHAASASPIYPFSPIDSRFAVARYFAGVCGDGSPDLGEACDDGNLVSGDCCSPTCDYESAGSPCDDGTSDACTAADACDGSGACASGGPIGCAPCETCALPNGCVAAPRPACKLPVQSGAARLFLKRSASDARQLRWQWQAEAATTIGDFGAPDGDDATALCIFDGASQVAVFASVPGGGMCGTRPCWKAQRNGYRYRNADGAPAGVVAMLLKAGDDGKAKIQVDGKRSHLVLPDLASLAVPLRVQLQAGNGRCWEASYSAVGVIQQDGERFKARSD